MKMRVVTALNGGKKNSIAMSRKFFFTFLRFFTWCVVRVLLRRCSWSTDDSTCVTLLKTNLSSHSRCRVSLFEVVNSERNRWSCRWWATIEILRPIILILIHRAYLKPVIFSKFFITGMENSLSDLLSFESLHMTNPAAKKVMRYSLDCIVIDLKKWRHLVWNLISSSEWSAWLLLWSLHPPLNSDWIVLMLRFSYAQVRSSPWSSLSRFHLRD